MKCGIGSHIIVLLGLQQWSAPLSAFVHHLAEVATACPRSAAAARDWELALPHARCRMFYTCARGQRTERACPVGLLYNTKLWMCDYPHHVDCDNGAALRKYNPSKSFKSSGSNSDDDSDSDDSDSDDSDSDDSDSDSDDSNSDPFHKPTQVPPYTSTVGPTEYPYTDWHPLTSPSVKKYYKHDPLWYAYKRYPGRQRLRRPGLGPIAPRARVKGMNVLTEVFLRNGCPLDGTVHWLLAHRGDCAQFYYCQSGEREPRACREGLHFNERLQICDWPKNANCGIMMKNLVLQKH